MKHETVNSIVAGLGLVLATFTAWAQFSPKADELQIISEGRTETGNRIETTEFGSINPATELPAPTIGPTTWRVRIHNQTDRSVSVVNWDFFLLSSEDKRIMYSAAREKLDPVDVSLSSLNLPINIPAHQTNAYLISAFIPFDRNVFEEEVDCFASKPTLHEAEKCVWHSQKDLFGNEITILNGDPSPHNMNVRWDDRPKAPKFLVEFETADGSKFPVVLSFYPNF